MDHPCERHILPVHDPGQGRVASFSPQGSPRSVSALLLIAALAACGRPHVFGLRHDPAFTYESLHGGSIAVGGVTGVTGDEPPAPATRSQFESLLATALMEAYPRLKVVPAGAVVAALGEASHTELLARYRLAGELDSAAQHEMNTRLANARYVILARIEADVTDSSETVTPDTLGKKEYETVNLAASRTMTVGFQVYDRLLGRSVWSGRAEQGRQRGEYLRGTQGVCGGVGDVHAQRRTQAPEPSVADEGLAPSVRGIHREPSQAAEETTALTSGSSHVLRAFVPRPESVYL